MKTTKIKLKFDNEIPLRKVFLIGVAYIIVFMLCLSSVVLIIIKLT